MEQANRILDEAWAHAGHLCRYPAAPCACRSPSLGDARIPMNRFPVQGIRSVDLTVPDLGAAIAFYTRVWGLALADRTPASAWLRGTGRRSASARVARGRGTDHHIHDVSRRAGNRSGCARADDSPRLGCAPIRGPGTRRTNSGGGTAIAVRDTVGRTIRIVQGDTLLDPLPSIPTGRAARAHQLQQRRCRARYEAVYPRSRVSRSPIARR